MPDSIYLQPEHELLREQVARFLAREVEPHGEAWEAAGFTPREVLRKLGGAGLLGLMAESRYGGADADAITNLVFAEALAQSTFAPDRIAVKLGETVRFVARNDGKVMHEFVIGTQAENAKHAEMMLKFPGMEHDEPYMAHVPPGKTGQIVWTFNRAGQFEFACLIAGHYQAGMVGTITVSAS